MEYCNYINIINISFRNTTFQTFLTFKVYPYISTILFPPRSPFKKTQQKSILHPNKTAILLQNEV